MKKLGLSILIMAALVITSCKNETKKDIKEETSEIGNEINEGLDEAGKELNEFGEDVKSAFDDITIPEFDDEEAEANLRSYAAYVKSQMDKGAENIKNSEFAKETNEFADKSEKFMENLGAEAKESYRATMAKINEKVKEIEDDIED
ncbi:hypothetical protein KO506_05105 [Polaribacter vadi]|uniref:hypothetical protein n=1 Tax=Polaribacter TaxID=52959 RepID=UPI001C086173|nr:MULTISPECIES: hypothetical protein [Polaribacter]MBU3010768.1 hypothetical protein [Polaribacter vadi]MDO6740579.1 hypothetical protein [Polaribacter sp. 1_MG-2023]